MEIPLEDQKVCGRCKTTQDIEEFARREASRQDRHTWCKTCKRRYNKDRYDSNPERERQRVTLRRDQHAELMIAIIREAKSVPCLDCGGSFPHYVMDFDHVRGEKLFDIGQGRSRSERVLRAEMAKCEVVCANCHRERTHG